MRNEHRLSGLDASFLYLETASQPLHVCALITLDTSTVPGGYRFDRFAARLGARARDIPEFRRKLHDSPMNLVHPVWVDDPGFDLEHHLFRAELSAPGGPRELAEACARIAEEHLDRRRPLWQLHVLEGLADGSVAVVIKMHHACVDGVSGANLLAYLAGTEADAPPLKDAEQPEAEPPGQLALLWHSVGSLARRPVEVARLLPELVSMAPRWLGRALKGRGMPIPFTAPRTSLNGTITADRSVAYAAVELSEVKEIKQAFGVTVNDVVLAMCAGALRSFLRDRGELPRDPLLATVPVSVHERTEREIGSNRVSAFFTSLPTHLADPKARVVMLAERNRVAKEHHHSIDADMLADWAQFAAPAVFGFGIRTYASLRLAERLPVVHNLVVSNVPGPPTPLYLLGARMTGMYPLGPVFHGAGLNITVLSYNGIVHVGMLGAAALVPDLWPLADAIPEALADLKSAAAALA